jgi:hypothetical protein
LKKSFQVYKKTQDTGTLEIWNSMAWKPKHVVWTEEWYATLAVKFCEKLACTTGFVQI